MSIVQTSREDKEKGLWRQQISLSCAKEVSAPLMGKLLMWPFEKVLWWCCRAKDIPRDRHHIRNTAHGASAAVRCAPRRYSRRYRSAVVFKLGIRLTYEYEIRSIREGLQNIQNLVYTRWIRVNVQHCLPVYQLIKLSVAAVSLCVSVPLCVSVSLCYH